MRTRRFAAGVVLAGVLPWVLVTWPSGWYPLFSAGFLHVETLSFTSLPAYVDRVGDVPRHLQAWPIAVFLWVGAVAAALVDRVDASVTVGLLVLAGASVLSLSLSLSGQRNITAVPLGTLWLWTVAIVGYAGLFVGD